MSYEQPPGEYGQQQEPSQQPQQEPPPPQEPYAPPPPPMPAQQPYAPPPMQPQQPYAPPMQAQQAGVPAQGYDWTVTLILSILVGEFGVDRFYTGSIMLGILKLITFGGCGIWWLIDIILIVTGSFKDAYGRPLVRKI
ncbi:MAG TPA: TM2 domain-containing protein [Ktedonobacterales bacterium]